MSLRDKLNNRIDELELLMISNRHLSNPEEVTALIDRLTYAWEVLTEEDRDYIQCCQYAIEETMEWNIDE